MSDVKIKGFDISTPLPGSGCTGRVFKATRKSDGKQFAVKRYSSMAVDRPLLEFCLQQYQQLPAHEGIVTLESCQFKDAPYTTVSEFIDSPVLLDSGVHRESDAWHLIRKLAEAMGHAHKHGVFHANLHPGNIFYDPAADDQPARIRVGDFCAGMVGDYHFVNIEKTACYAAPEQLAGLGRDYAGGAAERWDVYSFGVIAFWLLTGRLPRGSNYMEKRALEIEAQGGRPVPLDPVELAQSLHDEKEIEWGRKVGTGMKEGNWRAIIDQCLELNPADRPVDIREIRNLFENLDVRFDLIEAEEKANAELEEIENYYHGERARQRKKLISARASATILAISWFAATFFLVTVLQRTIESGTKINKLGQLIANQKAQIVNLDNMVEDTAENLRRSREAADTTFYQLTRASTGRTSARDLERVRRYYVKVLDEVSTEPGAAEERARALHSLAHIESRLNRKQEAREHFEKAIESFKQAGDSENPDVDTLRRLADCYEYLGMLRKDDGGAESALATKRAISYYQKVLDVDPADKTVALRLALLSFQYGRNLFKEKRIEEAVASYTSSANKIQALIAAGEISDDTRDIDQIISELQYHAAEALHDLERFEDAFDAYLATIESVERLRNVQGFGKHEAMMMARSFMALGDIMRESDSIKFDDKDQVYNEALRLASPMNREEPRNVEVAILMCQILSRIADLERQNGNPRDGYEMSVNGIVGLIKALDAEPDNVTGFIQLAEARLNHLRFLEADIPKSRVIALRGVDTAKHAHRLVTETEGFAGEVKLKLSGKLSHIFSAYYEICKRLGEAKAASECSQLASFKVGLK